MTIKHLAYRIGHEFTGSVAGLASLMNKGEVVLRNKLNPNSESHFLTIQEFETMADFTQRNQDVAEYFSEKAGGVFIKLPTVPDGDMALLDLFMGAMKELGEVSAEFMKAYADGDISNAEYMKISNEIDDVLARLLEFKAAVKRVVR
ncbi:MAG: hypothetical protein Q8M99_11760 [Methylotenera sp.]|nr:hypothetical protein [Methylotenera sp.]